MRLVADILSIDLACRHLDRPWAFINMFGIVLSFGLSVLSIKTWGLMGAGVATVLTYSILSLVRLAVLAWVKPQKGKDVIRSSVEEWEEI